MKQWKWYVYIIECQNNTYYTGLTWKPEIRYGQHLTGFGGKYTAQHGVKGLAYVEEHEDLEVARNREKQIKDWNQTKKQNLIKRKWKKEW